jgi:hypothetical protein
VGYGRSDHATWCEHSSVVSIWSIFRRDYDPLKPQVTIEVPNCLSSLAFHPVQNTILVTGSINGEIVVWDTDFNEEKGEQAKKISESAADDYFHREAITEMMWVET